MLTLNQQIYGDQANPAIVILHGLFGAAKNWHSIAKQLSEHYCIYALDLRNHGASPWDDAMDYQALATDVKLMIEQQQLTDVILVGHSMGGKTAMTLALTEPQLLQKLIVVDIAPVTYEQAFMRYIKAMQAIDFSQSSSRQLVDQALSEAFPELGIRQFLLQNLVSSDGGYRWRVNLQALEQHLPTLSAFPDFGDANYDKPTHWIYGGKSDYVQEQHRPIIEGYFPQSHWHCIENAGHWVHAEQPQAFLQTLQQCLAT